MFDVEQKKPRSEKVSRHCKKKKNIQNYLRWMVKKINGAAILELLENFLSPEVYTSYITTYTEV